MLSLLFLIGLAAVVTGVALVSIPAALVVGGTVLCGTAVALQRGRARLAAAQRPATTTTPGGDD